MVRRIASGVRSMGDVLVSARPILSRELLGLLRTRKAFWITVLTVGGASLIPLFTWPEEGSPMPFLSSHWAYEAYTNTLGGAILLFLPLVAGSAITLERERETYPLLYSTLIRPSGMVIGKLMASSAFFLLLLVLTFPVACLLYPLGGFDIWEFVKYLGDTVFFTVVIAVVGLRSSMRNQRTPQAVIEAFVVVIVLSLLPGFIMVFLFYLGWGPATTAGYLQISSYAFYGAALIAFSISLLRNARFPEPPPSRRAARRALRASESHSRSPGRTFFTRFLLASSENGIPDGRNPVFYAAVKSDPLWKAGSRRKLFWGMGILVALLSASFLTIGTASTALLAGTHMLLYAGVLILPGSSAAALTAERELGKLDFLRSTLLTPFNIIEGKLRASLLGGSTLPILGAIFCLILIPGLKKDEEPMILLYFLASSVAVALVAASSGLLASTLCRTSVASLVLAYVITMGILIVGPLLARSVSSSYKSLSPLLSYSWVSTSALGSRRAGTVFWPSIGLSIGIAALEIYLSVLIFRRRWMRDIG